MSESDSTETNFSYLKKLPYKITTNLPNQSDEDQLTTGRKNLRKWLGHVLRIVITDGRIFIGFFNCTDRDANIVLSSAHQYLNTDESEPHKLGDIVICKKDIVSIAIDMPNEEVKEKEKEN